MASRAVLLEVREVKRAAELIELGARMQVLEAETSLSRDKLLKLYKELKGVSPPKGMLPFSADWYMTWSPNIHSSMFYNIYEFMCESGKLSSIEALTRAYRLYVEQTGPHDGVPVLSLTRAWTLIRFSTATSFSSRSVRNARDASSHTAIHSPRTTSADCASPLPAQAVRALPKNWLLRKMVTLELHLISAQKQKSP
jgi:hypothetical protein